MPLMQKKSKKAFEHNVKAEMAAGKPQKQSLAIAFSVQRKPKKKMAEGGPVSAKSEKRPMPDEHTEALKANTEAIRASKNTSGLKIHPFEQSELKLESEKDKDFQTESRPMPKKGMKTSAIKHPKMVPQSAYSVRLRDEEDHLESSDAPASPMEQPPEHDDEERPDRQGPRVPDMQRQHDNGRKAYAKGGEIQPEPKLPDSTRTYEDVSRHRRLVKKNKENYAEGGMINEEVSMKDAEEDHAEHPPGLESDDDMMSPPEDEFMAGHFAEGGSVDNEEEIEHAASIAAAIMSKMRRERMAEGGEVNGHDSIYAHPEEDQADLKRNAEEDANMEDQSSFDALKKENYSESEGLEALDQPHDSNLSGDPREDQEENIHDGDIVSAIRRKMKIKSAITR